METSLFAEVKSSSWSQLQSQIPQATTLHTVCLKKLIRQSSNCKEPEFFACPKFNDVTLNPIIACALCCLSSRVINPMVKLNGCRSSCTNKEVICFCLHMR